MLPAGSQTPGQTAHFPRLPPEVKDALPSYVNYAEVISRWRSLPPEQKRTLRWAAIPRQVAASMAFEGEPVDNQWLETQHARATPPAGLKPAGGFSATRN